MNNIYLVGFMATGKTSVGQELARRNNLEFIDLDDLIEKKEARKITKIFSENGEEYFRKLEHEALIKVARQENLVVACGGGIVINPHNIKIMEESGKPICLTASSEVILKRAGGHGHRPLLNVPDPKKKIEELLRQRAPFYAGFASIDTSNLSISQVVKEIEKLANE